MQKSITKVVAVLVTCNRLNLLKEAVFALQDQSYSIATTLVINNGSTDGTEEWLEGQENLVVVNQANSGGAGGFYTGIKLASELNAEWVWVMDDDTVCKPDTLARLMEKTELSIPNIGFIGSKCVWTDGNPHLMNIPAIKPSFNKTLPFSTYDQHQLLLTETSSFVSLLINMDAVKAIGLPYKEFFIWGDDQEYTRRITKNGFLGCYCLDSVATHKTPVNYFPDFYTDVPSNLWKHKHGFRNEFFMVKKEKGFAYYIVWLIAKIGYTSMKIINRRKSHRLSFITTLVTAAWHSIFFNPKINHS